MQIGAKLRKMEAQDSDFAMLQIHSLLYKITNPAVQTATIENINNLRDDSC